ncbi:MAG: hypothetical protein VXW65_08300, partial [Pseudomonadota bacterium]|nr:hypothetical protein [Pseudomonadota bacterium]
CFDYNDFVSARSLAETLRRNPDLEDDLVGQQLTLSVYQSALHSTPIDWLQDGLTALIESLAQWQQLGQVIDEKLGHDAPVFSKTQELLQEVQQHLQAVAGLETVEQDNPLPDTAPDIVAEDTESAGQRAQPSVGFSPKAGSHVQNRQHALQVLQQVSDYFALNEPHSPVTYLLQKTIRWASMPLHQWLAQVVKQDDVLTQMQDVLGVEPSHEES